MLRSGKLGFPRLGNAGRHHVNGDWKKWVQDRRVVGGEKKEEMGEMLLDY